jgi:hypothetical protein
MPAACCGVKFGATAPVCGPLFNADISIGDLQPEVADVGCGAFRSSADAGI